MARIRCVAAVLVYGFMTLLSTGVAPASEVGATIDRVAGRLRQEQSTTDPSAGNWEIGFNGSIVAGMVSAYEYTGNRAYAVAAELGGDYLLADAASGLFGDDAYALMRLSQRAEDPEANPWRTVLVSFYERVRNGDGGTAGYVDSYRTIDPSTAVFYLAHHVVAAHYVDAADEDLWRSMLITCLAEVNDAEAEYPVMAMGVATWALAQTSPLDGTLVAGAGNTVWSGTTLADLPAMLMSHQAPEGTDNAGTFYWRFDHRDDGAGFAAGGYTEDTVFAVLGLLAASRANPEVNVDAAVEAACDALLRAADADGRVNMTLSGDGPTHMAFAGELLQVLPELDATWAVGRWLVSGQARDGDLAGGWTREKDFTGTLLTGVLAALERFPHNAEFRDASALAGLRVLSHANLFGDEAFAVTCLSEADVNPTDNPFRSALAQFYENVRTAEGGTEAYIAGYAEIDPSFAAFYLAHHVLSAHYVDAADKGLWRDALIRTLAHVDDSAQYPVLALGAATWALAGTGTLDATPIGDGSVGLWDNRTLADLPAMLLSHQTPQGQANAGSFYWRFDHADNDDAASGYTEDAAFGLLGLKAAVGFDDATSSAIASAIAAAETALANGIGGSGKVYEHLSGEGELYYSYAAEALMALGE